MILLDEMTRSQKVAALMVLLGPDVSAEIMKNIEDEELLEQITIDIASLNRVERALLEPILDEFHTLFQAKDMVSTGGMDYAKTILENAYGKNHARRLLDRLTDIMDSNPFQFFEDVEPDRLADILKNENPQLIALILAHLKPDNAAVVLNYLEPSLQSKVALKIARTDSINPEIAFEIEKIIEKRFSVTKSKAAKPANGTETLANILNRTDRDTEKNIIELLEIQNPDLAENVRERMFMFEDIAILEDVDIRRILKEIDLKDLALALKGAKQNVKDKVLSNMSQRAQVILNEDIELLGSVRTKDALEIQTKIVSVIKELEEKGEIAFYRDDTGEDELIN